MRRSGFCLALFAAPACLALPGPAFAVAPTPPGGIPVVAGTLDYNAAEGSAERADSVALLDAFPSAPAIIYLDLSIAPKVDMRDPNAPDLDFFTQFYGPDGAAVKGLACQPEAAQIYGGEVSALSVSTAGLNPNLGLTIIAGGPAAPFNAIACASSPSMAGKAVLHVTGFYVIHEVALPAARELRLVAYTPPYEQAMSALGRSHADP